MDRSKSIGGSDAAAIMGLSRYRTPIDVWMEKTGISKNSIDSRFVYWGNALEDLVCREFSKQTGLSVRRKNSLLIDKEHAFITGNIDRQVVGENAFLEAKTCSAYKTSEWDNAAPDEYIAQCAHYMMVGGYSHCYLAVLIGGNDFRWFRMERDESVIAAVRTAEVGFWEKYVESNICPPAMGGDDQNLFSLFSESDDIADECEFLDEYMAVSSAIRDQEKRKEELRAIILRGLEGRRLGRSESHMVSVGTYSQSRFDATAFKLKHPDLHAQFVKSASITKLAVKELSK